LAGG
jgi:hypothetical protein